MRNRSLLAVRRSLYGLLLAATFGAGCSVPGDDLMQTGENHRQVEVPVHIDFVSDTAPSAKAGDGFSSSTTPLRNGGGFSWHLIPGVSTKTAVRLPDQLYNFEIQQYDQAGKRIGGMPAALTLATGSALTVSLAADPDCQLVAVAWGEGRTTRLGTGDLSSVQSLTVEAASVAALNPESQADMNRMPYVVHLKHVCVAEGRIQSLKGEDVRLLLRRLAARLTVDWDYGVPEYTLRQILLQSVPLNYKVVPAPDASDNPSYPSLLDQFTTIQLTPAQIGSGHYACWLPANVRGTNPAATSSQFRTKQTAPIGSSFVDFIAVNASDSKKKLDYRVYLGGEESADFNVYENTDYHYQAAFNHQQLPVNDRRVTIIDPVPASENNSNLVPTANCFMVSPGGSFCFDPFLFQQNGGPIENTLLKTWADQEGGIISVKLLWQTKENGDVGDPVMGIVNSDDDHTNIVEIKHADGTDVTPSSPLTGNSDGRIYCRVAPNTTGGSGLIAAYSASGILWSWHVWITDYNPDPVGQATQLSPVTKRKLRLLNPSTNACQCVMMDRNLGAFDGFDAIPATIREMSRANGFHYQKGRKDPFPSSYTTEKLPQVFTFVLSDDYPPKHFLNRYKPNGIDWVIPGTLPCGTLRNAYKDPVSISQSNSQGQQWCSDASLPTWGSTKTWHDPCPAGWRIPAQEDVQILVDYNKGYSDWSGAIASGGILLQYDRTASRNYLRFTGYPPKQTQLNGVGELGLITVYDRRKAFEVNATGFIHSGKAVRIASWEDADAHTTRCIQERID